MPGWVKWLVAVAGGALIVGAAIGPDLLELGFELQDQKEAEQEAAAQRPAREAQDVAWRFLRMAPERRAGFALSADERRAINQYFDGTEESALWAQMYFTFRVAFAGQDGNPDMSENERDELAAFLTTLGASPPEDLVPQDSSEAP